jgi:prepilin-type N-terminal cleavage/methylation domain-containing protein
MTCASDRASQRAIRRIRRASTLIELMVTLAVLSIVSAVATLALGGVASGRLREDAWSAVTVARAQALREGRAVTLRLRAAGRVVVATAFPDGSIVADSALGLDPLTGQRRNPSLPEEGARE